MADRQFIRALREAGRRGWKRSGWLADWVPPLSV